MVIKLILRYIAKYVPNINVIISICYIRTF
jgi:hypothetical protein